MMRRSWIAAALACCACGHAPRPAETLLPAIVDHVWTRQSLRAIPPPQNNIARAFEAVYQGNGRLTVDLYETRADAVAFEMMQRWKPAPDAVFFNQHAYFVVVKWEKADRQALSGFVRALPKEGGL